jgi:H/ACA ribonucleoprotein complex subunit 4
MGEILGVGASMIELRRTKVCDFTNESNFVRLHDLVDAFQLYKETKNEEKLRRIVLPIEIAMTHLPAVIVRDTAIDALCHGAQLAMPGVVSISKDIKKGDLVGIYSIKGEIIGLGISVLDFEEFFNKKKGICFQIKRIVMKPNTYPKFWSTTTTDTEENATLESPSKHDHNSEDEDSESIFSDNYN